VSSNLTAPTIFFTPATAGEAKGSPPTRARYRASGLLPGQPMNKLILNLSVLISTALCVLVFVQWQRESQLTRDKIKLTNDIHTNKVLIQDLQVALRTTQQELERVQAIRAKLEDTVKTNEVRIRELSRELEKTIEERDAKNLQVEQYKVALEQANENITKQNEAITRQNETIKNLVAQRDEQVEAYKKLAEQYNKAVSEYNKLVEEVKKANEAIQAAAEQQQQQRSGGSRK
jgi:chromosome segregation ATPase